MWRLVAMFAARHILLFCSVWLVTVAASSSTMAQQEDAFPVHPIVQGDNAESLRLAEQYANETKARYGEKSPEYGAAINNLARLLTEMSLFDEAEPLLRRSLAIAEATYGPRDRRVAAALSNLAQLLKITQREDEAEPLLQRSLEIDEKSAGPDDPKTGVDLANLAKLLQDTNRSSEAEPLSRRAIAILEKKPGPNASDLAAAYNNLATLLYEKEEYKEAETLVRKALKIEEKTFGRNHAAVAASCSNLAEILEEEGETEEAEGFLRRALDIDKSIFGPSHPNVAVQLNNLGTLQQKMSRLSEAEPLMREALRIDESSLGAVHPTVGIDLQNLAGLLEDKGQWAEAAALYARAKPIMTGENVRSRSAGELRKVALAQNKAGFMDYARVLYHAGADSPANRAEAFELVQWALQNEAAAALSSMAARFSRGNQRLGQLVREQQDLAAARDAAYHNLDAAAAKADAKAAETARAAIRQTEAKLKNKDSELRKTFPAYAEFVSPNPLPLPDAQALLGAKALVLFLDMPRWGKLPEETIIFAVTGNEVRWVKLSIGMGAIRAGVKALRCGLDDTNWEPGEESRETCTKFLKTESSPFETPPFDTALAHVMYRRLFGSIEDLIKDRELLIVPSGALTQLPFEVLVTQKPDEAVPRFEAYKTAAWLGQRQAITILPSVGSLRALQAAQASEGRRPYLGIGNPLLDGLDGNDKRAWAKQTCQRSSAKNTRIDRKASRMRAPFRAGAIDVDDLRHQSPLPESADELCGVATVLGVPDAGLDKSVYLGSRATVRQVKTLSRTGELAAARVVHFATHGLLAGETARFAKNKAEPALLLTPPAANEASDDDNGLLNASEVAQLKLNADWVILSACNTAAGADDGAEALSGLARAFFYAGARSLLVSHWEVDSEAAVAITTGAVNAMRADPKMGRAEALRSAEVALIAKGGTFAHPSVWAPFVLVGNGEQ